MTQAIPVAVIGDRPTQFFSPWKCLLAGQIDPDRPVDIQLRAASIALAAMIEGSEMARCPLATRTRLRGLAMSIDGLADMAQEERLEAILADRPQRSRLARAWDGVRWFLS